MLMPSEENKFLVIIKYYCLIGKYRDKFGNITYMGNIMNQLMLKSLQLELGQILNPMSPITRVSCFAITLCIKGNFIR